MLSAHVILFIPLGFSWKCRNHHAPRISPVFVFLVIISTLPDQIATKNCLPNFETDPTQQTFGTSSRVLEVLKGKEAILALLFHQ